MEGAEERAVEGAAPAASRQVGFPCGGCGAELRWDPDADALLCDHCGTRVPVPRAEGTILERPLEAAGEAARGLGLALRVARCSACGARVTFDDRATSTACVYCGSPSVLAQEARRNALRPESLVPLDVGRAAVERGFRRWVRGLWFRPAALARARVDEAVGVYLPYWTFDASVHSDWTAVSGTYYWTTVPTVVLVKGKPQVVTRTVRQVRWRPVRGAREDAYDDRLVCASRGVPAELAAELGPYDVQALVPYRPEYLAGWRAEEYQLDLEEAWRRAQAEIEAEQRRRCAADVPGDTHRDLAVRNVVRDVRWKHVLLPVWILRYAHGGKSYTVLVHGQTGRVVGRAPYSWGKIALAVLAAVLAALVLLALLQFTRA